MDGVCSLSSLFPMLNARALELLDRLPALYEEWNARINLVSRRDVENLMLHHVAHSLALCHVAPLRAGARVLDFGTGGGFPGIPLAIAYPDVDFHLIDSVGKKVRVVEDIAQRLGLENVRTSQVRGEGLREGYTHVVSRAVASLDQVWRWVRPLLDPPCGDEMRGLFAYKGGAVRVEVAPFGSRASMWPISDRIPDPYFQEKYIVYIPSVG